MLGTAADLPDKFRLASDFRIDVTTATDRQVLDEIARLISAYLHSLRLERTADGVHSGSAYDMFLAKNNLPASARAGRNRCPVLATSVAAVRAVERSRYIRPYERWLRFHPHTMQFGDQELAGLKLFLRQGAAPSQPTRAANPLSPFFLLAALPLVGALLGETRSRRRLASNWIVAGIASLFLCAIMAAAMGSPDADRGPLNTISHAGNCVSCHPAPEFTDIRFHNTGATQEEYDSVHGASSFARLTVPSYAERRRLPDRYLPATPAHPHATGVFRSVPALANPGAADLGMWNIFANPDFPEVQSRMRTLLCDTGPCDPRQQLPRTIARFRTPALRDLGHSWPYLHTGRMTTVEDVLHFYLRMSVLAKEGQLRNADPELTRISVDEPTSPPSPPSSAHWTKTTTTNCPKEQR